MGLAFLQEAPALEVFTRSQNEFFTAVGPSFLCGWRTGTFVGVIRRDNGMKRICGYVELVNRFELCVFPKNGWGPLRPEKSWLKPSVSNSGKDHRSFPDTGLRSHCLRFSRRVEACFCDWRKSWTRLWLSPAALREKAEIFTRYLVEGSSCGALGRCPVVELP